MESEAVIHLQLEFGCCPDPLTGCVSREGATPMPFTGWIGMHAAIETMLNAAREGGDGHAPAFGAKR